MSSVRFESLYPASSREAEVGKILGFVRAGLSCQIIGLPGVGRSNLLGLFAFNHNVRARHLGEEQKNYHFIYLNFAEAKNTDIVGINKFLFLHLLESLEERKYKAPAAKIQNLFDQALASQEPLILWQNLKKAVDILTNGLGLSLILLFDRFEEYQESVTSEFFLNLRTLRSLAKYRFAVIFALSHPLEKTLDHSIYKEFYEFLVGHLVYLPIRDEPGLEFRLGHLEQTLGKRLAPKIKEELLRLTGGQGKLTKAGAEAILSHEPTHLRGVPQAGRQTSQPRLTAQHHLGGEKRLDDFLLKQADVQAALFEISQSLTTAEIDFVQRILAGEKIESGETLDFLLNIDLLKRADRTLKITIPLITPYFKNLAPSGLTEEKIYFRSQTNEIVKGDQVISDGLTAQEFRLLKFLLENSGRVCEREEIIRAVWPEAKTTEGISDEAIDQMVFRLRKKTETDPKNPQHLQTIKGRGFRFNP